MMRLFFLLFLATLTARALDFNAIVLEQVRSMPEGGGYAVTREAHEALISSVSSDGSTLKIDAKNAIPSYCSGATYLIFLKSLAAATKQANDEPRDIEWKKLQPARVADGINVWGRWNANGPGTARLFYELKLGRNFTSIEEARPGDFLKIFWKDAVGKNEFGHSVIFLGCENKDGVEHVRFWSSNKPAGYGEKSVPRSKMAKTLFSRLETPSNLRNLPSLRHSDPYLASLLTKESSFKEALQLCGVE
jgi:hypothetical protein